MKRRIRLLAGIILSVAMMAGMLTGCANNIRAAVQVGDEKVTEEEAKFCLYSAQYETEENAQVDIAYSFGDPMTYWNSEYLYTTYAELTKSFVMEEIIQTKVLVSYANANGIKLDAADEAKIQATADEYMTREFVLKASGADEALVKKVLTENAIANKVFSILSADVDTTFDDSVIRHRNDGVFITAIATDADENEISVDDQKANVTEALKKVQSLFDEGKTYEEIQEACAEEELVNVTAIGEFPVAAADMEPDAEGKISPFYQFVWDIPEGETQDAVLEVNEDTFYGYLVTCISADDEEYKNSAKEEVMDTRRNDAFSAAYADIFAKYGKFHVYNDIWDNINIESMMYPNPLLQSLQGGEGISAEQILDMMESQSEAETAEDE